MGNRASQYYAMLVVFVLDVQNCTITWLLSALPSILEDKGEGDGSSYVYLFSNFDESKWNIL